jgi:aryl-alcohol dehydrogenase-like predicted oxidoreductase
VTTPLTLRPLGKTGLSVTPLGLAAMSVRAGGPKNKLAPEDVERAFHEHGINAFLVHFMMKELCAGVRRLIEAGHRDKLVLVSEVGLPFAGSVRRGLEKNLRVLGTDRLDVWLLGWVQARWYARKGVWTAMRKLKDDGMVRAIGYSSHNRGLAAALARELSPDVIMIRYNAAHRGAERDIFEPLGEEGPAVIAYTATRWGALLKSLPARGFAQGMTAPECYRFVLGHPSVDMVWCAARTPDELLEDVRGVAAGPLDPARREEICRFGDAVHATARGSQKWGFR